MFCFIVADPRFEGEEVAELVDAREETLSSKGVDFEGRLGSVRQDERKALEIDRHARPGIAFDGGTQALVHRSLDANGQEPIFEGVVPEDVAERAGDDGPETPPSEGPRGVLARRAAAEVVPRQEDLRAAARLPVERKVRIEAAVR